MRRIALIIALSTAQLFAYRQPASAQSWIELGKQEYRANHFAEATEDFQKAVAQDPTNVSARLFLASVHMVQYVPGAESEGSQEHLAKARAEYQAVLQLDAANQQALASLANLSYFETYSLLDEASKAQKLEEARGFARKLSEAHPDDKEAYYMLGAFTWSEWYPAYQRARRSLGMKPDQPGPLPNAATRQDLLNAWGTKLDEAITNLQRALEIDAEYSNAMSYLNLLLRERADLRDTSFEYQQDVTEADRWAKQVVELKRQHKPAALPRDVAPQAPAGAINFDVNPETALHTAPPILAPAALPPPPPPLLPPPPPTRRGAVRIGGKVAEANLVKKVEPIYPPLAMSARIQGVVEFTAQISEDGIVIGLQLVRGHPLLVQAARDAVLQWVYRPTLLNGQPVPVETDIVVSFAISQ